MFKPLIATALAAGLLLPGVYAQDAKTIPDLKGTWEGAAHLHHKLHGHVKDDTKTNNLVFESQEGRVIHGTVGWANKKVSGKNAISGVIDKDGVTLYMVGHTEATIIGKLDGPDALTLYVLVPGGANPRAGFIEFKRVK